MNAALVLGLPDPGYWLLGAPGEKARAFFFREVGQGKPPASLMGDPPGHRERRILVPGRKGKGYRYRMEGSYSRTVAYRFSQSSASHQSAKEQANL
jgi:hypothetical protein